MIGQRRCCRAGSPEVLNCATVPPGDTCNILRHLVVTAGGRGSWWVEARDAVKHPKTTGQPMTENDQPKASSVRRWRHPQAARRRARWCGHRGWLRDRPPCFLRSELMGCFKLESDVVAQEGVGTLWGEDNLAGRLHTSVLPLSGLPGALPRPGGPHSAPCPRGCPRRTRPTRAQLWSWALMVLQLRA